MSPAPKKVDVSTVLSIKDLEVKSIELKLPEDEQEKTLRLHKERLSFYFKELGTLVFATILVIVVVICCLGLLFNSQSAPAEKDWARSVLMAVLTGDRRIRFRQSHEIILQRIKAGGTSRSPF